MFQLTTLIIPINIFIRLADDPDSGLATSFILLAGGVKERKTFRKCEIAVFIVLSC